MKDITRREGLIMSAAALGTFASPASASRHGSPTVRRPQGIIDVHAHALLPRWVDALAAAMQQPRDKLVVAGARLPDWSPEAHLRMMDEHGIEAAVLSWPSATSFLKGKAARDLARGMNEDFAEIISRYPGRFGAFAALPLDDMEATNEETHYALDTLKLDGVATGTHIGGIYLGDPRYNPWFQELDRRGAVLFVHPTVPPEGPQNRIGINPATIEFMFESTRTLTNLVLTGTKARFSQVKIISTHGGGALPYLASRIGLVQPLGGPPQGYPEIPVEQMARDFSTFYFDLTAMTGAAPMAAIRQLVPTSQLMLGSDFAMMPAYTFTTVMDNFAAYPGLKADERQAIVRGSALRLLPGLAARLVAARR